MFKIVRKQTFTENLFLIEMAAEPIARSAGPGQYVDIRINPDASALTVPLAGADSEAGTITVVLRALDLAAERLMMLQEGDEIFQVRGPLGAAVDDYGSARVVLVGEGVGVASLLWRAREYRARGAYTICILGFTTRDDVFWEKEFTATSDELYITTEDGSYGISGTATGPVRAVCETHTDIDRLVMIGGLKHMKRAASIAEKNGIAARMSFDAVYSEAGAASIFGADDDAQKSFQFARASELDAREIDFDKLITRQRALAAQSAESAPQS